MDLLINAYGTRIRSRGERIVLAFPDGKKQEYPARRVEKIIILRPSSISTGAVQLALEHDIDIVYLGSFGKPIGRIFPSHPKGLAELRRAQLAFAHSPQALRLAKQFVQGKSQNQIAYLRRLQATGQADRSPEIIQAEALLKTVDLIPDNAHGRMQLFGVEGFIADQYFAGLKKLYRFPGRHPRGRDRFNSALNYGYGMLYNEVERACLYVGLDPYLGLYHSERYGKPALVLDLVEEFRVPVVDSTIFPLFISKTLTGIANYARDSSGRYTLSPEGKRQVVAAVYQRLNQPVAWVGRRIPVKTVIDYQARAISWIFLGRRKTYSPFPYAAVLNTDAQ